MHVATTMILTIWEGLPNALPNAQSWTGLKTKHIMIDPDVSKSKDCMEEKSQEVQTSNRSFQSVTERLGSPYLKNVGSDTGEKNERTSVAEAVRKCWPARLAKEQISKRLDGKKGC